MKKQRLKEIEMLRTLAFFFVIMQHALGSAPSDFSMSAGWVTVANFLMVIAEPGVAIFLFISGLTIAYSYKENMDIKRYYKNRFLYLIIPYFIFSYINMLLYNPDRISNFLGQTLAGNGGFHLWYMGMFIRLVIIFPVLIYVGRWLHKRNIVIRIFAFLALLKGYMYVSIHQGGIKEGAANFIFGQPTELQMRFVNISILFWSIYVIFGMYAAFNYDIFKRVVLKYRYIVYGMFILTFYYKFSRQFDFVEYNLLFDIAYRTSNILMFYIVGEYVIKREILSSVMGFISKYSYAGYMLHIYALNRIIFPLRSVGIDHPVINAVISGIGATFLVTGMVYVITLIPKSKIITGVNDNFYHVKIALNYLINSKLLNGRLIGRINKFKVLDD
ncbi:acyltransferase [Clostridium sardiniense]|uniref:acyltransferase n=1 Tax=Clostridium sardiniense TaxID=29369 RepID=UPI001956C966|nr:acyltransferase [Clostridium sardiniense]MBM7836258.1 peptidoglycan/LPS O-acetylase OafA/YrhL [Clostridium sardiniense]